MRFSELLFWVCLDSETPFPVNSRDELHTPKSQLLSNSCDRDQWFQQFSSESASLFIPFVNFIRADQSHKTASNPMFYVEVSLFQSKDEPEGSEG
jgi:hypothetical protein